MDSGLLPGRSAEARPSGSALRKAQRIKGSCHPMHTASRGMRCSETCSVSTLCAPARHFQQVRCKGTLIIPLKEGFKEPHLLGATPAKGVVPPPPTSHASQHHAHHPTCAPDACRLKSVHLQLRSESHQLNSLVVRQYELIACFGRLGGRRVRGSDLDRWEAAQKQPLALREAAQTEPLALSGPESDMAPSDLSQALDMRLQGAGCGVGCVDRVRVALHAPTRPPHLLLLGARPSCTTPRPPSHLRPLGVRASSHLCPVRPPIPALHAAFPPTTVQQYNGTTEHK
eukprot:360225-Chlamydomonas_euryale.AAC.2